MKNNYELQNNDSKLEKQMTSEELIEHGRQIIKKARPSFNFSLALHFASYPNETPNPNNLPSYIPWYVKRNLSKLGI